MADHGSDSDNHIGHQIKAMKATTTNLILVARILRGIVARFCNRRDNLGLRVR